MTSSEITERDKARTTGCREGSFHSQNFPLGEPGWGSKQQEVDGGAVPGIILLRPRGHFLVNITTLKRLFST